MKFGVENKNFSDDLKIMYNALCNKEHFAFSKFADGELMILKGNSIDLTNKCNGEFKYRRGNFADEEFRDALTNSFRHQDPNYFIGIGCSCCIGEEDYNWMKSMSDQNQENLTWANIFVNSNYEFYFKNFIPEYKNHKVIMVCNRKANLTHLFPNLVKDFRVGTNAWKDDYRLIYEIKNYIDKNKIEDHLFLFAAGPFGNLLAHQLFSHNNKNTYIDIGSTLDPLMGLGGTRGYHVGAPTINKVCIW